MRKKQGFTLVELLVVMAIISILAAIAIPNVNRWIKRSRAVQASSEIHNIELALTKLASDAGRSGIADMINTQALYLQVELDHGSLPVDATPVDWDTDAFDIALEYYTRLAYVLLRKGRGALISTENLNNANGDLLREDVVRNLGVSYMTDLGFDPWGNLYQFYPGPWSTSQMGTIPFRTYLPPAVAPGNQLPGDDATALDGDELTLLGLITADPNAIELLDPDTGDDMDRIGIPADTGKDVFIWSYGENGLSGQALYRNVATGYDPADGADNYDNTIQEPEFLGGGDDINNWDKDQTFMRFYN